jgi:thymidylate kinase
METPENQQRVREVYMTMVENSELVRVEGNRSVGDVAGDVLKVVLDFLERSHMPYG